ncbi:MAG: cupin domain-containing protein [Rhizobiaceae bacterium]
MKLKKLASLAAILVAGTTSLALAHDASDVVHLGKPNIKNLMTKTLKGADGIEVIMSHVALPPNFTLPMHWHPGEEFAYIVEGSVTLILDGEGEVVMSKGGSGVVPLKKIHTARSGEKGATIVVFRVHEKGQPGRVLVKQ